MLAQLVGEMKVNMLVAKNQLSRLVKDALAGKDVVIASNGKPIVRLLLDTPVALWSLTARPSPAPTWTISSPATTQPTSPPVLLRRSD
jgi:prevent-host-death family protein